MDFVKAYNDATSSQAGTIVPAEITNLRRPQLQFHHQDPSAAVMLRQAARIEKGSSEPHKEMVGVVTRAQVKEIAEVKMPDLNANDVKAAMLIVEGTARSMGIHGRGLSGQPRNDYQWEIGHRVGPPEPRRYT